MTGPLGVGLALKIGGRPPGIGGGNGGNGGGDADLVDFFSVSGGGKPTYSVTSYPSALYHSGQDRTWFVWQGWTGFLRDILVQTYDHTAGEWSGLGRPMRSRLIDDDHSIPAIAVDHEGYAHVAVAGHDSGSIQTASSTNIGDPLAWTDRTEFSGSFTYVHLLAVGTGLILISRELSTQRRGVLWETTALADGAPTWGSKVVFAEPEGTDRLYVGTTLLVGSKVHMVATIANQTNSTRSDVYYLIYDTATGSVFNHDESTEVAAASLPVDRATLDSDFRIVSMAGDETWYPTLAFDTTGRPHVGYIQENGAVFDVRHIHKTSLGAAAWEDPVTVDSVAEHQGSPTLVQLPSDELEYWYVDDPDAEFSRGGDVLRAIWDGSSWGTPATVQEGDATETDGGVNEPHAIMDGHADARVLFGEVAPTANDSDTGGQRIWTRGDSGYIGRALQDPDGATSAVLAALAAPTDERKALIDMLVSHLKDHGIWAKLDAFYMFAAETQADALVNWIDPGTFDATLRGTTDPTFTADSGFETDGVDQDVFSNFDPSVDATQFVRDDACLGAWFGLNNTGAGACGFLAGGGAGTFINPRSGSGAASARCNSDGTNVSEGGRDDARGLHAVNRSGSSAQQLYRWGTQVASNNTASDPIPSGTFRFGGTNTAVRAQIVRAGFFGASLTAAQHRALSVGLGAFIEHVTGGP